MFNKIMTTLYVVTAIAAATGLTTLVVLTEMEGPLWVAIMAALGVVVTFLFAVLLLAALLFACFIALNNAANRRQNEKDFQEVIHNNQPL
jgi:pilus assembly protein TadC